MMTSIIIYAAASAAVAGLCGWLITRSVFIARLSAQEEMHKREIENTERMAKQAQDNYDKALKEMKETVVNSMTAETERLLKKREEELASGNQSTMDGILKPLKESIAAMQKAMKENETSHVEVTSRLATQLEHAVKEMKEKTSDVGKKADSLSEALTGRPKVQGCFGENFLDDILVREGLKEGMHYTREAANQDRSRPDFVFHFKDGFEEKDLIVDSKVSLTAYVEYVNATSPEEKAAAMEKHLKSIHKHIDELSRKDYAKKTTKSFADYVLMFMPIEMAFRTALETEQMLWQEAYQKNILIVTEQTIMPFLKIIHLTWNKYRHDTKIQDITRAAQNMIDRVAEFYSKYSEIGKKLKAVGEAYNAGAKKLQEGGHSITTSARQVVELGTKMSSGKEMTIPDEISGIVDEE